MCQIREMRDFLWRYVGAKRAAYTIENSREATGEQNFQLYQIHRVYIHVFWRSFVCHDHLKLETIEQFLCIWIKLEDSAIPQNEVPYRVGQSD
jgi:hypothetical protein